MAKQTQMQHPYELFAYQVGKDMKGLDVRVSKLEESGQNQSQTENSTTAAIQTPIKAFVFNIEAEISPEDQKKIESETHYIDYHLKDIVLSIDSKYAGKFYLASTAWQNNVTGMVGTNGKVTLPAMDHSSAQKPQKVVLFVFDETEIKVPVHYPLKERNNPLNEAHNLIVDKGQSGINAILVEGVNSEGEPDKRYLAFDQDHLTITALEGENAETIVFDSYSDTEKAEKIMSKAGPHFLNLSENLYKIEVNAWEGEVLTEEIRIGSTA